MKRGKAPGPDNIIIDTIVEGGDIIMRELAKLFTTCIKQGKVPQQWKEANMIILFKKGDKRDLKNYRPISLLSNVYKLFTRILTNRLENILDSNQPREQAGFRSGYSTMDHIHTINQLKEKCLEYNQPLCMVFIDYEKAFDSVETQSVLGALQQQGVESTYINLLRDVYTNCTTTVTLHKESAKINIKKGVRQGDTISHKLFTACLESIFRSLQWDSMGVNINGEKLNHLRFADDIIIITESLEEMETMLSEIAEASKKCGLKMNMQKTKVMTSSLVPQRKITVNGHDIEEVEEYIYLGQRFSLKEKGQEQEILRRIKLGWRQYGKLSNIMRGDIPICLKRKVFNQCIIPSYIWGSNLLGLLQ